RRRPPLLARGAGRRHHVGVRPARRLVAARAARGGGSRVREAKAVRTIGYVVSQYPAVTHTFILREIRGLRALGFDVRVISISGPDRAAGAMTAEEREELAATDYVKTAGAARALAGHARALVADPVGYARGLWW